MRNNKMKEQKTGAIRKQSHVSVLYIWDYSSQCLYWIVTLSHNMF